MQNKLIEALHWIVLCARTSSRSDKDHQTTEKILDDLDFLLAHLQRVGVDETFRKHVAGMALYYPRLTRAVVLLDGHKLEQDKGRL